jgi:phosphate starvation-inducible PhoH-like protein
MMPHALVAKGLAENQIEIAPLAFMRGRTLANAFVILDEAQNTSPQQMKMFLTRLGERSRMVVTGDPTQVDLPNGTTSGLADALSILKGVKGIATVKFETSDIVRHQLVGRIVQAYENVKQAPERKPRPTR